MFQQSSRIVVGGPLDLFRVVHSHAAAIQLSLSPDCISRLTGVQLTKLMRIPEASAVPPVQAGARKNRVVCPCVP